MLIDPDGFDLHLKLYETYVKCVTEDTIFSTEKYHKSEWWAEQLPNDSAQAEEFRQRILSYVRDLEAEVLLLRPKAKAHDDMVADVEAGIEAQFKNEGALR